MPSNGGRTALQPPRRIIDQDRGAQTLFQEPAAVQATPRRGAVLPAPPVAAG
ncbi:MAG TPA: hypothetical protein VJ646_07075 [Candidatus Binatia bacterium]|nr:hypothetical protein [Candidatus Binatia bacterium]